MSLSHSEVSYTVTSQDMLSRTDASVQDEKAQNTQVTLRKPLTVPAHAVPVPTVSALVNGSPYPIYAVDRLPLVAVQNLVRESVTPSTESITVPVSVALDSYTGSRTISIPSALSAISSVTYSVSSVFSLPGSITSTAVHSIIPTSSVGALASSQPLVSSVPLYSTPAPSIHVPPSTTHTSSLHLLLPAIAGGIVVFLLCAALAARLLCYRRRVQKRDISKPIPQAVFEADSPIFGTDEKFANAGDAENNIWTWTQYSLPYRGDPASTSPKSSCDEKTIISPLEIIKLDDSAPPPRPLISDRAPTLMETLNESLSRLSAISVSMFPRPPSLSREDIESNVGSAGTVYPLLHADDPESRRLTVLSRLSTQTSPYGGYLQSLSPPSEPLPAPQLPPPVPRSSSSTSSRHRIKTPYVAGHYKRPSTTTITGAPLPSSNAVYRVPRLPSLYAPEPYFDAMAADGAWPLSSQSPSDQPGGDPDADEDEERRQLRRLAVQSVEHATAAMEERRRQRAQLSRSVTDASAALGNLMLIGFETPGTSRSLTRSERKASTGSFKSLKSTARTDWPPRVPSPPPLPSLAQMALTRADSDADYRSPTYSLYTYYGPDA